MTGLIGKMGCHKYGEQTLIYQHTCPLVEFLLCADFTQKLGTMTG